MKQLVSVIIPAHNEEEYIEETIKSILTQTYQHFELIIVDDGSKDSTRKIVQSLMKKDKRIKLIPFDQGHSAAFARNAGAKIAKGSILIFQDADAYADPQMINVIVEQIEKGYDGVAARTLNAPPKTAIGKAIEVQRLLRWETIEEQSKPINQNSGILVANMRKKCFDSLKGFDDSIFYFEDANLTNRFFEKGYKAVYEPRAKEFHHDPETWKETLGQAKSFGKGIAWLLKKNKGHKKLILPIYSLGLLITLPVAIIYPLLLIAWTPLVLLFLFLTIRSLDPISSLLFIILFIVRNVIKLQSTIQNYFKN